MQPDAIVTKRPATLVSDRRTVYGRMFKPWGLSHLGFLHLGMACLLYPSLLSL